MLQPKLQNKHWQPHIAPQSPKVSTATHFGEEIQSIWLWDSSEKPWAHFLFVPPISERQSPCAGDVLHHNLNRSTLEMAAACSSTGLFCLILTAQMHSSTNSAVADIKSFDNLTRKCLLSAVVPEYWGSEAEGE